MNENNRPLEDLVLSDVTFEAYGDGDVGVVINDDAWKVLWNKPVGLLVGPDDILKLIVWLTNAYAYSVNALEKDSEDVEQTA